MKPSTNPRNPGFLGALQTAAGASSKSGSRKPAQEFAVPGYEILAELGRGGMGVVYKARQVKLNRLVALKMILSGSHCGGEDLRSFHLEAEAVARLHHPNIVQIYEVGECNGRPYFSLEYVEGGSLQDFTNGDPQSPTLAARLIEQLARGVDCAHKQRIIHGDLKPANILIARSAPLTGDTAFAQHDTVTGPDLLAHFAAVSTADESLRLVPKIADFGLAKQIDNHATMTAKADLAGTPQYMAPELMQTTTISTIGFAADV